MTNSAKCSLSTSLPILISCIKKRLQSPNHLRSRGRFCLDRLEGRLARKSLTKRLAVRHVLQVWTTRPKSRRNESLSADSSPKLHDVKTNFTRSVLPSFFSFITDSMQRTESCAVARHRYPSNFQSRPCVSLLSRPVGLRLPLTSVSVNWKSSQAVECKVTHGAAVRYIQG